MTRGAAAWAVAAAVMACGGPGAGGPSGKASDAKTLSMFSTTLPESAEQQAMAALRREAWRTEHRFRDAADPGYLFRSTRITQDEVESGAYDPEQLFELGGQLFHLGFDRSVGFGGADLPLLGRVHSGARGGPEATRCATCHWRGGPAGAGDAADNALLRSDGQSVSAAIVRNPPALVGAGLREIVAGEMTVELQQIRSEALTFSAQQGYAIRIDLTAKNVLFGQLTVHPDGQVDTSEVEGVDADLVVRPFGWKGTFGSIRDVVEDALNVHHGMQSEYLVLSASAERMGSAGGDDPDGDGVSHEITEGQVSALTLYVAMQELPQEIPPPDSMLLLRWAQGRADFETLGCADCHTPTMKLAVPRFALQSRQGGPTYTVQMNTQAAEPRLTEDPTSATFDVRMYTDLKRHRMGAELAEPRPVDGLPDDTFITPPLWGIARSRPYLHDARAPTIEDAILLHGGQAQRSRDAFAALPEVERAPLRVFLASLTRAPRMVTQ